MNRIARISNAIAVVFAISFSMPALANQSKECTELCDCASLCSKPCSFAFNGPLNHTCAEVGLCVGGYDCGGFAAGGSEKAAAGRASAELPWLATSCTPESRHAAVASRNR
ncbi:MAG: hypothetical protein ABJC13_03605 [Acidobacteriota bacterium]